MSLTETKQTTCGICLANCPAKVTVSDGVITQVEPSEYGNGYLCVKGHAARAYVYREDRIKTPLRRTGQRGDGDFEPISWEAAYLEISKRLLAIREKEGADSVAFYTGYPKWYRPMLHRLAHSFGTQNYGTESSSCMTASMLAHRLSAGVYCVPDIDHTELLISWGDNPFYSGNYTGDRLDALKEKGLRVIAIDPRVTPYTQKYADIHLRPRPGTDGALAHFLAQALISADAVDRAFIEEHVHGFAPYAAYVRHFTRGYVAAITRIPEEQLGAAVSLLLAHHGRFTISSSQVALTHHVNGVQNYRAVYSLCAITGNFDRTGGLIPRSYSGKLEARNKPALRTAALVDETRPQESLPKIGSGRFPLWTDEIDEFQAMDLSRQILEKTPYPIRALVGFGLNVRMFPGDDRLFKALEELDFYVNVDLFMTDSSKYADIVLPACTPFERSELVGGMGGTVRYVHPAIQPLHESRSDADIICALSQAMGLQDPVLNGGYELVQKYLLRDVGLLHNHLKDEPQPHRIPGKAPYTVGATLQSGLDTPTGKYELYSERIASYDTRYGYDPLPTYKDPPETPDEDYPLALCVGGRLPFAFHSRFHDVKWTRQLRPHPALDIHPADARVRRIRQDDEIVVTTPHGSITVRANLTHIVPSGTVFFYHGYSEADGNAILDVNGLDPYSGFPAYRSAKCRITGIQRGAAARDAGTDQ